MRISDWSSDVCSSDLPRSGKPKEACILVVDDSATIRAVIGKMLAQNGHHVLKAGDGESALEIARNERPDLIFLDIVMPGMSGFAVDRKSGGEGKSVSVRVDLGGRRIIKKKKKK